MSAGRNASAAFALLLAQYVKRLNTVDYNTKYKISSYLSNICSTVSSGSARKPLRTQSVSVMKNGDGERL